MITRMGAAPRLPGMSIAQFQEHWRTSHADAAGAIPGVRRYVQNHAVLVAGAMVLPYPGFDACSELDFDSVEAMDAGFASPTYLREVASDEKAFVDKDRFSLVVAEREILIDPPSHGVKLVVYYRTHPTSDTHRLLATLRTSHATQVAVSGATGYELLDPIAQAHTPDRYPAAADAVVITWWASVEDALDFERGEAQVALAGIALGAARLITRPIVVV